MDTNGAQDVLRQPLAYKSNYYVLCTARLSVLLRRPVRFAVRSNAKIDIKDDGYREQNGVACRYQGVLEKTFVAVMTRGKSKAIVLCEEAIQQDGGGRDVSEEEVGGLYCRIVQ